MKVVNKTNLDTNRLRNLFTETKGNVKSSGLLVIVYNCNRLAHGMAWNVRSFRMNHKQNYIKCNDAIELWINTARQYPITTILRSRDGYKSFMCIDPYNLITLIFLHEIGHVKDYQKGKSSKYRQTHCDEYAIKQAEKYGIAWETSRLVPVIIKEKE